MPLPACQLSVSKPHPFKSEHLFTAIPSLVSAADGMSDHCMYLVAHSLKQCVLLSTLVAVLYVKEAVCGVQL